MTATASTPSSGVKHALLIGNTDGIGFAVTRKLLQGDGAGSHTHITGVSRSPSAIEDPRYTHHVLDVGAEDYAAALEAIVQGAPVPIDTCIYFVGVGDPFDLRRLSDDARVFKVNLIGLVETVGVVVPRFVERGCGHLIGLSSLADASISKDAPSYAASKAGFSSYLEGLGLALDEHGVKVTNVRLGFVDTKMARSPIKPMMISPEKAAELVMRCMDKKAPRLSRPVLMSAVMRLVGFVFFLRLLIPDMLFF